MKVLKQRTYNAFVENEALEDYSLRYASRSFRKWPEWLLASTALGGISFLALEAIGALLVINYGFTNSTYAIVVVMVVIFFTGLPITLYAARYNIDIDLLTRGAGFGFIGSTITSLIYAGFTFIFFAAEASIMAEALLLCLGIPLPVGYVLCSIVIIPLVFFGITFINKLQLYTQPIWITLMILPFVCILYKEPEAVSIWVNFGENQSFNVFLFGSAMTIALSLIAQIGEQVDYLRFLPDKTTANRFKWNMAVILAGPGWIIIGGAKMLGGAFLAALAIQHWGIGQSEAIKPVYLYLNAFNYVLDNKTAVLVLTTVFVLVSQIKINVTNAYAGSLAWSNFFSRVTHSHPGRVVWLIFNVLIALLLMQFGFFFTIKWVLGIYANVAIAWIGAIVADLTILKPLKISPPYIEFRRGHLHKINPVGVGAMLVASFISIPAYFGQFGPYFESFSAIISFIVALLTSVVIALVTRGKYYIARPQNNFETTKDILECAICNKKYEYRDMTKCSVYNKNICSLCCSLDIRCNDMCKSEAILEDNLKNVGIITDPYANLVPRDIRNQIRKFLTLFITFTVGLLIVFTIFFYSAKLNNYPDLDHLFRIFLSIFLFMVVFVGICSWWLSLIQEYHQRTEKELDVHINDLETEINEHKKTTEELKKAQRQSEIEFMTRMEVSKQQKLILENTTIGIAYVKKDRIVWYNHYFVKMCSIKEEALPGLHVRRLFKNRDSYSTIKNEFYTDISNGLKYTKEVKMKKGRNETYWCRLSGSALDPENIYSGSIWLLDDISEQKRVLEELSESEERLRQFNEHLEERVTERTKALELSHQSLQEADKMASLGILVAGMAHEINNPVGFIKLNSKIINDAFVDILPILDKYEEDLEEMIIAGMDYSYARSSIPKLLKGIDEGTGRISGIVSNLRDYSRQNPLNMKQRVNINQALATSLSLLANEIKNKTDHLKVKTTANLPSFSGDRQNIEQVIINLIHNSCQALTHKRQEIQIASFQDNTNHIVLKIKDQGEGIPSQDLKHVFDPFFTTKRRQGGTGLGLSISSKIIEKHNGNITIESEVGKGTEVTLQFPT